VPTLGIRNTLKMYEEMKKYERLVALIKPKQISVTKLGGLKAGEVVRQVATRLGRKFTMHTHMKCWKHYDTRPAGKSSHSRGLRQPLLLLRCGSQGLHLHAGVGRFSRGEVD
jgi:hypothetical protein